MPMYKNGALTKEAREKLERRYAKERAKDSILAKIDAKNKKISKSKSKKKIQAATTNKIAGAPPRTAAPKSRPTQAVIDIRTCERDDDLVSECPSTPPRDTIVRERNAIMQANKGVNWISMTNHVQLQAEDEEQLCFRLEKRSKESFKASLEGEMGLREDIRQKEHQEKLAYQQSQKDLYKKWEEEDALKIGAKQKKIETLKAMRQDQIKVLEKRRHNIHKKELRREIRQMKKNEEERIRYEQEKLDLKKKHYDEMQQVLVENAKQKEITMAEEAKQAEEEVRLQKQYSEMLRKQEESRAERLAKTYAQADQKAANLLDCTALEREVIAESERKAEEELRRRQAAEDERNRLKAERLRKENLEVQEYLSNQIQRREKELEQEIHADRKWGKRMNEEALESLKADETKVVDRQKRLYEQADYIKKQIRDNEAQRIKERADMTEQERLMNYSLIRDVENKHTGVREMPYDPKKPFAWRYNYRAKPF